MAFFRLGGSETDGWRDDAGLWIDSLREKTKLALIIVTNDAAGAVRAAARCGTQPSSRSYSEKVKQL